MKTISAHPRNVSAGFSLVELLVVIAIIAVLAGGLAIGLRGAGGSSLKAATNLVAAQLNSARTSAILNNAPALLLIGQNPEGSDGRQKMIVLRQIVTSGGNSTWEQTGPAVKLPQGTFVVLEGASPRSTKASGPDAPLGTNFDGKNWSYYKFSSTGSCEENAGARVVIASGILSGSNWVKPNEAMIQGLFLTRLGEAILFDNPDHIRNSFGAAP